MNPTQKHALSISVVLFLVLISIYFIYPPAKSTRLGLDLKGGMHVILSAKPFPGSPVTENAMDQAMLIIRQRVDKLGVAEPEITRQGRNNILVQLPGIKRPEKALEIIGKPAFLEFKEVKGTDKKGKIILGKTEMTGRYLKDAQVDFDELGKPKVNLQFTSEGGRKFEEVTGRLVGKQLAIVLDGKVMSAPQVREKISGGRAEITGDFTIDKAKELALVLQTGALPVKLEIEENRTVGPTLGADSLRAGIKAGIIGLILVALYMLLYYRGLGGITCVALLVFATLFWGVIVIINKFTSWGWPLTLPGIAGIILTIGVAADSSIVIFERVKEEVKVGKTLRSAADSGFTHAFKTILDADFVTLIAAVILVFVGIGPVRGFAISLICGICLDLFTALFFTRPLLALLVRFKPFTRPTLVGIKEVVPE